MEPRSGACGRSDAQQRRWRWESLGLAPLPSVAESRALLVGVGHYQYPGIDLPAIDLDLERMRETLNRLGFENRQIRTLLDEQATSTAVVKEFATWLREGVKPDDRVVFYFSGHGSNVPDLDGDESDRADEVLVTHDMRRRNVAGRSTLQGVVTDDQIARADRQDPEPERDRAGGCLPLRHGHAFVHAGQSQPRRASRCS